MDATRGLRRGGWGLDPFTARSALASLRQAAHTDAPGASRLSPREVEGLNLRAQGGLIRELARHLCISENTVKAHFQKIHDKLQSMPAS